VGMLVYMETASAVNRKEFGGMTTSLSWVLRTWLLLN
jgi:hypothetical protein